MVDSTKTIVGRQHIHSTYVRTGREEDAIVVKERLIYDDGSSSPNIAIYENYKRPAYVTKPLHRVHNEKKEFEHISKLDRVTATDAALPNVLHRALNVNDNRPAYRPPMLRDVCESPFIYGADIKAETFLRHSYMLKQTMNNVKIVEPTRGMLDTETNILPERGDDFTTHVSFTVENKPYIGILKSVFVQKDKDGNEVPCDPETLKQMYLETYADYVSKVTAGSKKVKAALAARGEFTDLTVYLADTPVELLLWSLKTIQRSHVDFMGIWNADYDIKQYIKQLEHAGVDLADAFSHPSVPKKFRRFNYRQDMKKHVQHPTRRWHYVDATSSAYFYCAQNLYSINRTPTGLSPVGYSLDAVLKHNACGSKFKISGPDMEDLATTTQWHRYMQANRPYEYALYSIFDVVPLQIMEWVNSDVLNANDLLEQSGFSVLTRQSRRYANGLFFFAAKQSLILGSVGADMAEEGDELLERIGGAVLTPERIHDAGVRCVLELPGIRLAVYRYNSDIDFTAMYPSIQSGANVSKGTLLVTMTAVQLAGAWVPGSRIAALVTTPMANCARIANDYFALPTYEQIDDIVADVLAESERQAA